MISMDINKFIENFVEQLDEAPETGLTPETNFRELDEWSSLCALAILSMIDEEYNVQLKGIEMRGANTIQELFDLVLSKIG